MVTIDVDNGEMTTCKACGILYHWKKSTSRWLKMTYCGTLCEIRDLGFALDSIEHLERKPVVVEGG